ncbi:AraC family transcriptional regulator [Marivivens marinus]|uniref:AraC family transcriptional regulator n=1 Tax=Marivivens marinus TaxID=3110173 RepID=UPI003B84733D
MTDLPWVERDMPERQLAGVLHKGPYNQIGPAFGRLHEALSGSGQLQASGAWLGVYLDDLATTAPADLRSYAACEFPADQPVPDGMERITLPACRAAIFLHEGPYEGLPSFWEGVTATIRDHAIPVGTGPCWEAYLNDPTTTAPENLRTEVGMPLA